MKVVIDLIEDIREEIANQGDFVFLAMLLKQNDKGEMELIGEKLISRVGLIGNEFLFYVDSKERTLFVEPVLKMLNALSNEDMMLEVKISVNGQKFDVVGFGKSEKDKKFVLFLEG